MAVMKQIIRELPEATSSQDNSLLTFLLCFQRKSLRLLEIQLNLKDLQELDQTMNFKSKKIKDCSVY